MYYRLYYIASVFLCIYKDLLLVGDSSNWIGPLYLCSSFFAILHGGRIRLTNFNIILRSLLGFLAIRLFAIALLQISPLEIYLHYYLIPIFSLIFIDLRNELISSLAFAAVSLVILSLFLKQINLAMFGVCIAWSLSDLIIRYSQENFLDNIATFGFIVSILSLFQGNTDLNPKHLQLGYVDFLFQCCLFISFKNLKQLYLFPLRMMDLLILNSLRK